MTTGSSSLSLVSLLQWSRQQSAQCVGAGISTLAGRPSEDVQTYLKPLLDFAASVIPAQAHKDTPFFLLATAGMRLLELDDQATILDSVCAFARGSYEFNVPDIAECRAQHVRVISGEEEGLYGWLAVNYLMDGFDMHELAPKGSTRHASTYGFLDMGGASTQIAFEPSESEREKHADNLVDVHMHLLSGRQVTHPVFVSTWLGFGTNQARNRYVDQEVRRHVRASDEALAHGVENVHGTDAEDDDAIEDPCLPRGLIQNVDSKHSGYRLRGTGDFAACVRRTAPLLNKDAACPDLPCLFDGVHVPAIDFSVNHFVGISEYWYSMQDVWKPRDASVYDFVEFERNAQAYCGSDWRDLVNDHAAGTRWAPHVELSRLEMQCFKAAWVVNVLHDGIGIPRIIDSGGLGDGRNQSEKGELKAEEKNLLNAVGRPHFQSMSQVNDVAISWTLGKMVLEVAQGTTTPGSSVPPSVMPPIQPPHHDPISDPYTSGEWTGHVPSWSGNVRDRIASAKLHSEPLAYVALAAICIALYLMAPLFSRSRSRLLGAFVPTKRPRRGTDEEAGQRSKQNWHPLSDVKLAIYRAASAIKSWSRPDGYDSLPSFRASSSSSEEARPQRTLRHVHSTPALSMRPPATSLRGGTPASHMSVAPASHWNDAPDVSQRALRSRGTPTPTPPPTAAPKPSMTVVPPTPNQQASSPGWTTPVMSASASSLNLNGSGRLTPRRQTSEDPFDHMPGEQLASALWERTRNLPSRASTRSAGASPRRKDIASLDE